MFIRLDRVPACDRRTDRQTDRRNCCRCYSALHCKQCGRAVKTVNVKGKGLAINKTCTLTSRSRIECYKRLVSVSIFYVSCLSPVQTINRYVCLRVCVTVCTTSVWPRVCVGVSCASPATCQATIVRQVYGKVDKGNGKAEPATCVARLCGSFLASNGLPKRSMAKRLKYGWARLKMRGRCSKKSI